MSLKTLVLQKVIDVIGWKTIGCAVQGKGHIAAGIPCQDKIYKYKNGNIHVIALADGAGSAKYSHFGAECVTRNACEKVGRDFYKLLSSPNPRKELLSFLLDRLEELAAEKQCSLNDLASTLLLAAADNEQCMTLHIGDGVIGYFKKTEEGTKTYDKVLVASHPENGEFTNTTTFVTSRNAESSMRMSKGKVGPISGFVLMSDGSEMSLYDKRKKQLAPFLSRIKQDCVVYTDAEERISKELEEDFQAVICKRTHDDCSMIMMGRPSDSFRGARDLTDTEKFDLYAIPQISLRRNKRIKETERLFLSADAAVSSKTLKEISRSFGLKAKYLKKRLERLCQLGLFEKDGKSRYRARIVV